MGKLVSKCGIDCSSCPWGPYPRKSMTAQEFERYRNAAKEVLGYMPIKTPCVACQTPDEEIPKGSKLPNRKCLIRQCVDKTGVENCAYCLRFPCDTLKATAGLWNRKNIEEKHGSPISEQEYRVFVEPFEGIDRLETIRASLKQDEIVEPAKITTLETAVVDFPKKLSFSIKETTAFKSVHRLLALLQQSSLGMLYIDTFSQHHKLENRKAHVFRFLWIMGSRGKLEEDTKAKLVIDAKTYLAERGSEKNLAIWAFLKDIIFPALSEFGVNCERIALEGVEEKDLTTGTDYLRNKGWIAKMSFDEKIGGSAAIRALQVYSQKTDEIYGGRAFQHFRYADMRALAKD